MSESNSDSEIDRSEEAMALLADELTRRLQAGEVVDLEALASHQPHRLAQLKQLMRIIEMMVDLGRSSASGVDLQDTDVLGLDTTIIGGDYRIIREIGRGGMGIVYEAVQISLSRKVALKVLPIGMAVDPKSKARFQIEATAASKLKHRNIVQVYSVGSENGLHYYAMQYIDGPSLSTVMRCLREERDEESPKSANQASSIARKLIDRIDPDASERPDDGLTIGGRQSAFRIPESPLFTNGRENDRAKSSHKLGIDYFRSIAYLGVQAAEALHHAHGLGVVHRDIKPANLLIDGQGSLWITDFGLARIKGQGDLTGSEDVIGTTRYMSPEQAEAKHLILDDRTDIYSLGVTLYELLTLEPAVTGTNSFELIQRIIHEEPIRPSHLAPSLPRDLETIILKAISKAPGDRYENALELAEDLRRFLGDQPVKARRVGQLERAYRTCRRHPLITALCTTIAILISSWGIYAYLSIAELQKAFGIANHQRAIQMKYWAATRAGEGDPSAVQWQALALQLLPESDTKMQRRIRHEFALNLSVMRPLADVVQIHKSANAAAISPDGKWVASGGDDGRIRLRRIGDETIRIERQLHIRPIRCLAFSPDCKILATGGDDGKVLLTRIDRPDDRPLILIHGDVVTALAFSYYGDRLLTGSTDKTARLWNVSRGELIQEISGHKDAVTSVAFVGRNPKRILTGTGEAEAKARVWDLSDTFQPVFLWEHSDRINTVAVNPEGTVALTGSSDLTACLWSLTDGRRLHSPLDHEAAVLTSVFSPDGLIVWTGGWDAKVRAWNVLDGTIQQPRAYASDRVVGLDCSSDGRLLMACGIDGKALVWDSIESGSRATDKELSTGRFVVSDDLKWLLKFEQKSISLWMLDPLSRVGPVFEQDSPVRCAAFQAGTSKFLFALDDGSLKQIDTDAVPGQLGKFPSPVNVIATHPKGHYLLGFDDGSFQLFEKEKGSIGPLIRLSGSATSAAFSPSGDSFAMGSSTGHFAVWTTQIDILFDYRFGSRISAFGFDKDGSRLLIGGDNSYVRLFDVPEHMQIGPRMKVGGPVRFVEFAPDEMTFSTISTSGALSVINMDLEPIGPTLKPPVPSNWSVLQRDGETLVDISKSGRVRVHSIPRPATSRPEELTDSAILKSAIRFDMDGSIHHLDEAAWCDLRDR